MDMQQNGVPSVSTTDRNPLFYSANPHLFQSLHAVRSHNLARCRDNRGSLAAVVGFDLAFRGAEELYACAMAGTEAQKGTANAAAAMNRSLLKPSPSFLAKAIMVPLNLMRNSRWS